jgi:hypothetical protein
MHVSAGASCFAHCFRTLLGMLSGPVAFEVLMFSSIFFYSIFSNFNMIHVVVFTLIVVFGIVGAFPLVKTDIVNWFSSRFALCLLSLISCPLCFSGATPMLSCFLYSTYFQNALLLFLSMPYMIAVFIYCHSAFLIWLLHSF